MPTTLRRLPFPVAEPPYDDDPGGSQVSGAAAHAPVPTTQGTLALAFVLPSGVPAHPRLRLVPAPRTTPAPHTAPAGSADADRDTDARPEFDDDGPRATPRSALPDPRPWAGRFVQALVEVLGGARPATQLVRWTTSEVYADIQVLTSAARADGARTDAAASAGPAEDTCVAGELTQATRTSATRTSATPLQGTRPESARPMPAVRGLVRSIHVGEPADGVAEICALVQRGPRASAVALRLEGVDGRWKCTALALP